MADLGIRQRRAIQKLVEEAAIAADPLERLVPIVRLKDRSQELLIQAVGEARAAGATWTQIGDLLGVSKQAVLQRFGPGGRYDVGVASSRAKK